MADAKIKTVEVGAPVWCNLCGDESTPADYDEPIRWMGRVTWAHTCEAHHRSHGTDFDAGGRPVGCRITWAGKA